MSNIGRQVNLWRGEDAPPTLFHVWIKGDSIKVYDHDKSEWVNVMGNEITLDVVEDKINEKVSLIQKDVENVIYDDFLTTFVYGD